MSMLLRAAVTLSFLLSTAGVAQAQVAMSGEYGESSGRIVNIPLNPPRALCTNAATARCHQGSIDFGGGPSADQLSEPASGVGVDGAGVVIMPGGLAVGDQFTIPPLVFRQEPAGVVQFTPVIGSPAIVQLNTTLTAAMPATARVTSPQSGTRIFRANAWNQPGNGQTGRVAANTVPISGATQTVHEITLTYTAGANAFGGTMANLLDGDGSLFLTGVALMSSIGNPATRPWVGTNMLSDGIAGNLQTRNGAGWGYTRMGAQSAGVIRNNAGLSAPCTQDNPPAPAGCGLVTDFVGTTIGTIPSATSTKFMHAYTTGTVSVSFTGTVGGFGANQILTGMGYDTVSGAGTTAVRNIGMVAGSYTLRNSTGAPNRSGQQVIGVDMQFTPEPTATAALLGGIGLLGFLARRRA